MQTEEEFIASFLAIKPKPKPKTPPKPSPAVIAARKWVPENQRTEALLQRTLSNAELAKQRLEAELRERREKELIHEQALASYQQTLNATIEARYWAQQATESFRVAQVSCHIGREDSDWDLHPPYAG